MDDVALVRIVDAAVAEAARRAGDWLACRPGCAECCIGPFAITSLDARRLREGLSAVDPAVAGRVRARARNYPVDSLERLLAEDGPADSIPCPALDPETQTCDLYAWRPITCRTFGPPIGFNGGSYAVCELCFDGAAPEEVAACKVDVDLEELEGRLLAGDATETIVAYALTDAPALP